MERQGFLSSKQRRGETQNREGREGRSLPEILWLTPRLSLLAGELESLCEAGMFAA